VGIVLVALLLTAFVCWQWRYDVGVFLYYHWTAGTLPLYCARPMAKSGELLFVAVILLLLHLQQ
jgi:hypothetical protein